MVTDENRLAFYKLLDDMFVDLQRFPGAVHEERHALDAPPGSGLPPGRIEGVAEEQGVCAHGPLELES